MRVCMCKIANNERKRQDLKVGTFSDFDFSARQTILYSQFRQIHAQARTRHARKRRIKKIYFLDQVRARACRRVLMGVCAREKVLMGVCACEKVLMKVGAHVGTWTLDGDHVRRCSCELVHMGGTEGAHVSACTWEGAHVSVCM